MTQSRASLVSIQDTPYYHCISRCVRRAFLCGEDGYSGKSFNHRRQWMVERIHSLSNIFAIDICAYAIMSNHYHLVLHVNESEVESLSPEEVCSRWNQIYSLSPVVERWLSGKIRSDAERDVAFDIINTWRERLMDISWFMRCLNEYIARKANKEDDCKGRFWEGRFKSQALLDEQALLTCMAYVDLNPIRAKMAESVEQCEYTSVFERIHGVSYFDEEANVDHINKPLFAFSDDEFQDKLQGISYSLLDYFELVDWTGRIIRDNKRGVIHPNAPHLLSLLGVSNGDWLTLACSFGRDYHGAVGSLEELLQFAEHTGRRWVGGQSKLQRIFH